MIQKIQTWIISIIEIIHIGVSINGASPKQIVYFMENFMKMDDLGHLGVPLFKETFIYRM